MFEEMMQCPEPMYLRGRCCFRLIQRCGDEIKSSLLILSVSGFRRIRLHDCIGQQELSTHPLSVRRMPKRLHEVRERCVLLGSRRFVLHGWIAACVGHAKQPPLHRRVHPTVEIPVGQVHVFAVGAEADIERTKRLA